MSNRPQMPPSVDIVEQAHELIKARILSLGFEEMERLTAAVLRAMGYCTKLSPRGRDRGVDIKASLNHLQLQPRIKVQVKHRPKEKMGAPDIREFLGVMRTGDQGLYISTGGFTQDAAYEADRTDNPVTLIDLDELARLVDRYYEDFDDEGRKLLPLVRILLPM